MRAARDIEHRPPAAEKHHTVTPGVIYEAVHALVKGIFRSGQFPRVPYRPRGRQEKQGPAIRSRPHKGIGSRSGSDADRPEFRIIAFIFPVEVQILPALSVRRENELPLVTQRTYAAVAICRHRDYAPARETSSRVDEGKIPVKCEYGSVAGKQEAAAEGFCALWPDSVEIQGGGAAVFKQQHGPVIPDT